MGRLKTVLIAEHLIFNANQIGSESASNRRPADALAATGKAEEAIAAFSELAGQHPNHGGIQEGYGRRLLNDDNEASW